MVDEPTAGKYFGGDVAAPVFSQVVQQTLRTLGVPYADEDIAGATEAVKGKTELDALIAYLQVLGTSVK